MIRDAVPDATLDVVGDGYLRAQLERLGAPGVRLHGFADEPTKLELLRRADLVLMPATREGWGIVAIEAAMQGVPVVGYDVPGLRDAVVDGVTGVLTPACHQDLAAAAVALLGDPGRWLALSRTAQERARTRTWGYNGPVWLSPARTRASAGPMPEGASLER